jgi:uncharacterized membrane protein YdbT with pleckstrin-like domain
MDERRVIKRRASFWAVWPGWILVIPFLNWLGKSLEVTDKRVIMRQGVLSRNERSVSLDNVQDVIVKRGLIGSLFNWGTLMVETGASPGTEFVFRWLASPTRVRDAIFAAQDALREER